MMETNDLIKTYDFFDTEPETAEKNVMLQAKFKRRQKND